MYGVVRAASMPYGSSVALDARVFLNFGRRRARGVFVNPQALAERRDGCRWSGDALPWIRKLGLQPEEGLDWLTARPVEHLPRRWPGYVPRGCTVPKVHARDRVLPVALWC